MAAHYGVAVVPTRVRKPRDKAKVEGGVLIVERWILAALRHRQHFSLGQLNATLRELLEKLNSRPFRKFPAAGATTSSSWTNQPYSPCQLSVMSTRNGRRPE